MTRWSIVACPPIACALLAVLVSLCAASNVDAGRVDCTEPVFRRGDSNQDGGFDISDGVFDLNALFTGGDQPPCVDAADGNDDGNFDIADAVFKFGALFLGGNLPPAPGPNRCGTDPTRDELGCERYGSCVDVETRCVSNECCDDGQFCAKDIGDCDGTGECREIPLGCPDNIDPVCGCDGVTYNNECEAWTLGINIAHRGTCDDAPCLTSRECPDGLYCAKEAGACERRGRCVAPPEACPDVVDPVCGCDGVTYGNECEAAAAGVNVLHGGECNDACTSNENCSDTEFCRKVLGNCVGAGLCADRPLGCDDEFDPVCGCDGETYSNACEAAAVGVNVLHRGECREFCTSNDDCARAEFCRKEIGNCDGRGRCEPTPEVCPDVVDPVCGCDNVTYSNACEAAAVGVNVLHRGECGLVGCSSNDDCPDTEFCQKNGGNCDGDGRCAERPTACREILDPVCGCDGQTYENECFARAAGVNVERRGGCDEIVCANNTNCARDEFCLKATGSCNARGRCAERPTACLAVFDPVCGCDGETYGNECEANAAGVNVLRAGECDEACSDNADCPRASYCAKNIADCEGDGQCRERPLRCRDILQPVCGCDGDTYANACEAARAGVNVVGRGECE
jgi:hypothetical protein